MRRCRHGSQGAAVSAADAMLKIERARWWALQEQPFYGALAMRLADVIDESIETACTDGKVIRWNPEFVLSLTDEETRGVLLHETMHCAHLHMWRLPADETGNKAGDYAINLTLKAVPGIALPKGALMDAQFSNMAEEEIFARICPPPQPPEQGGNEAGEDDDGQQQGGGAGAGQDDGEGDQEGSGGAARDACGGFSAPAQDAPGAVEQAQQAQELRESWEQAVMQAAQAAQALGRGDLPGDLQRELDRMRAQQIDWKRELADFVRNAGQSRNDWARASRRHSWQRVIYPKRKPHDYGTIIAARDTSGSIDDRTVAQFTAMIEDLAGETQAKIIVIDCDARVQAEHAVEIGERVPLRAKGGGGTDFRPVFMRADEIAEGGERVAGIVYLTDLCGSEPEETEHATLWLSTTDSVARTGRTVRVTLDQ